MCVWREGEMGKGSEEKRSKPVSEAGEERREEGEREDANLLRKCPSRSERNAWLQQCEGSDYLSV